MILLDHTSLISHEAFSLFSEWQFWIAMFGIVSAIVGSYFKQRMDLNTLKIEQGHIDEKYNARINTLKEQMNSDRLTDRQNRKQLFDLCTEMNQRLSNLEGVLSKDK